MTVGVWSIASPCPLDARMLPCLFANRFPGVVRGRQLAAVHLRAKRFEDAPGGVDPDVRRDQHFFHLIEDRGIELPVTPKYTGEA